MYLLDSDLLIGLIRENADAVRFFSDHNDAEFATTIISACELFEGAYRSTNPEKQLDRVRTILSRLPILQVSDAGAQRFGKMAASLGQAGRMLDDFDLLIASIALEANHVLVTRNRKHFDRVPGLKIQTW